jgi:amino acid adenylation domain-containing protein
MKMNDRIEQTISECGSFTDRQIRHEQWIQGEVLKSHLSYWKQRIGDSPPVLALPTDRPRLVVQTFRGKIRGFTLPHSLTESLKALSHNEKVSLFMTLLAAFQVLLHRYAGQKDILVGTLIRTTAGFVNTLLLRTDASGDPSFRELLGRVREVVLGAYAHEDLSFEQLVEELQLGRGHASNHRSVFQVMFALKDAQMPADGIDDFSPGDPHSRTANMDLALLMEETVQGVKGSVQYNADQFEDATIARMAGHLETLLLGIVANPDRRLSMLPLLTEEERHQLLVEWNDTEKDYPKESCIHELVEAQVERTPDAVAVVFEGQELTYHELNAEANQLAHYLKKHGVGPEVLVGICMERSLEMVIGLLGVLKAGGAYVPLDPTYPKKSLAFMLEDTQVPVLLTQERRLEMLPEHGAKVVCLDTDWEVIAQESEEDPASQATADNLAYVIYTSGSTGKPKGAMNTHGGIYNRLLWMQEAYQLTEADRVLQKTPFSFDVSVWEFFWPLMTGSCLIVARPEGHRNSGYLLELIAAQKITTLHFVPSMLQVFLEDQGLETCSCLRRVICSGEALPQDLQERLFACLAAELHNLYGPTEAAVDVTYWACERESNRQTVPIGRPIANTQMYILDRHLQPVPVGVPGELHIGGVGLARGYLNRAELTAEKFIANPFSSEVGARLYKTGDLARYLPDGNIEFLGRLDHQVKIRGFRIEPGEIEAALADHPGVRQRVVIVREDEPGEKRLVAYVVLKQEPLPTTSELRSFLKERLPDYMVPSAFVLLDKMPLSPNGKVDRRALPAPDSARPQLEKAFVPPRTGLEHLLSAMWQSILGIEQIGIDDNFFELGGSSIQAAAFINKIQEKLAEIIHLVAIFDAPTVADFASYLHKHYSEAVSRICGAEPLHSIETTEDIAGSSHGEKIDAFKAQQMRQLLRRRKAR